MTTLPPSVLLRNYLTLGTIVGCVGLFAACSSDAPGPVSGSSGSPSSAAGAPTSGGSLASAGANSAGAPSGLAGAPSGIAGASGSNGGSAAGSGNVAGAAGQGLAGSGGAGGGAGTGGQGAAGSSGAAGTGGQGAAGSSGAAGAGGAGAGCAGKSYKFCEDFESSAAASLPAGWTSIKGYGVASANDQQVAVDQFHSGSKALKSIAGSKGTSRIQKALSSLGATATKHWGRVFFKVQSPSATLPTSVNSGYLHTTFVSMLGGSVENRIVDTVEMGPTHTYQWLYNLPSDAAGSGTESGYEYNFDEAWHCAEWYVDVGSMSYRFFYDSKEITKMAFSNKAAAQMVNYTTIVLGATYYQDTTLNPPFVVWFDDIAIDDAQIHCN